MYFILYLLSLGSGSLSLRRAEHSSRGVLPTVVCRCVRSRNLVNEEALAHLAGLLCQKKEGRKEGSGSLPTGVRNIHLRAHYTSFWVECLCIYSARLEECRFSIPPQLQFYYCFAHHHSS